MATLYGGAERGIARSVERRDAVTPLYRHSGEGWNPFCNSGYLDPGLRRGDDGYLENAMTTDAPINDTRKAELLSTEVEHIDIKSFDARPIVDAMRKMSFTSRDLGRAADIYNQMLADPDCSVSW